MSKTRTAATGLLLLLASCQTGASRQQVLQSLVGRPEADALRVLGAPNRMLTSGGHRFLAYDDRRIGYAAVPPPFGPFGYGFFYGPSSVPVERVCETTLEVVSGRVASWTLRGNDC